jgi:hypothetical protein
MQTLTVFVAFVTVLFGIRYDPMVRGIKDKIPDRDSMPKAREKARDGLRGLLWSKGVPLAVLAAIPAWLFLPLTVRIIEVSSFSPWNFDTLETGFVFLNYYLILFFFWCLYLIVRIALKGYRE